MTYSFRLKLGPSYLELNADIEMLSFKLESNKKWFHLEQIGLVKTAVNRCGNAPLVPN